MITIYVRTSSGKTISIKCDKKRKLVSIVDEVERRSTIPRSTTYLVHHGKVLNEKRTMEDNNIGTETTIDMSLRLLGEMEKSELMDTLESQLNERITNIEKILDMDEKYENRSEQSSDNRIPQ